MRKSAIILFTLLLITASLSAKKRNVEELEIWTDPSELTNIPADIILEQNRNTHLYESRHKPVTDSIGNVISFAVTNIKSDGYPKQCYLEKILPLEPAARQAKVLYIVNGTIVSEEYFLAIPDIEIKEIVVMLDTYSPKRYGGGASKVIVVELRDRKTSPWDYKSYKCR